MMTTRRRRNSLLVVLLRCALRCGVVFACTVICCCLPSFLTGPTHSGCLLERPHLFSVMADEIAEWHRDGVFELSGQNVVVRESLAGVRASSAQRDLQSLRGDPCYFFSEVYFAQQLAGEAAALIRGTSHSKCFRTSGAKDFCERTHGGTLQLSCLIASRGHVVSE